MFLCHCGFVGQSSSLWRVWALAILFLFCAAAGLDGQEPSGKGAIESAEQDASAEQDQPAAAQGAKGGAGGEAADISLRLKEYRFEDAKEGYVSLEWNSIPGAAEYRVTEDDGAVYYRGALPKAFISGLSDGTHYFRVRAVDESGNEIISADRPVTVVVEHWPRYYGIISFAVGLVVFLSIVGVIAYGALSTSADHEPPEGRNGGGNSSAAAGTGEHR